MREDGVGFVSTRGIQRHPPRRPSPPALRWRARFSSEKEAEFGGAGDATATKTNGSERLTRAGRWCRRRVVIVQAATAEISSEAARRRRIHSSAAADRTEEQRGGGQSGVARRGSQAGGWSKTMPNARGRRRGRWRRWRGSRQRRRARKSTDRAKLGWSRRGCCARARARVRSDQTNKKKRNQSIKKKNFHRNAH